MLIFINPNFLIMFSIAVLVRASENYCLLQADIVRELDRNIFLGTCHLELREELGKLPAREPYGDLPAREPPSRVSS